MAGLLPNPDNCCDLCEEPTSVAVPGPEGPEGPACVPCEDGVSSFTTAESFVMPAELANVTVTVLSSEWMTTGQIVWAKGGGAQGNFEVQSKPNTTSVILKNLEDTASGLYLTNSPPATVFPALTMIVASGQQGPAGTTPAGSAPDNATYITQTPNGTLSSEQALSVLATGYMKSTTATGVVTTQAVPIPIADGGTGGITAAAARTALAAAPASPTFILQTANAELGSAQALSTLATGYAKVTTATGVISSQAVPIPVADGGTGAITAAAARTSLNVLAGYGILGFADAVDLNVANSDNAITMLSARYRIDKVILESPSAAVTTATMGLFTAAGGGGTTLCANQALSGVLTGTTKFMDLVNQAVIGTDTRTEGTLYARVGTAEGAARTVNVKIIGWKFD